MEDISKKNATSERPDDVDKILSNKLADIGFIKILINSTHDYGGISAIVRSVESENLKEFFKSVIKTIETLSDYIEDLEIEANGLARDLVDSYETNKTLDKTLGKEIRRLKNRLDKENMSCGEWIKSYFSVQEECRELREKLKSAQEESKRMSDANHILFVRLENSEKMLKAAVSRIDDLYKRLTDVQNHAGVYTYKPYDDEYAKNKENKNKENKNSLYGMCAHDINSAYPTKIFHNSSNFCGNCRYCQTTVSGQYICTQHYVKDIDPDDSSCAKFKAPYEKSEKSEKPDHVCCENCTKKDDPDYCNYKCPLFPF